MLASVSSVVKSSGCRSADPVVDGLDDERWQVVLDGIEAAAGELSAAGDVTAAADEPAVPRDPTLVPGLNRANLRASMADGAAFGVMVGVGESYLAAFALAVGLGEISAGMVSSIPLLVGGILQLVSLRAVGWLGGEKRWILLCAGLQGLSFVPLVWAAATGSIGLVPLLLLASLYWAGGLASGPPWNTWMASIVPSRLRSGYFARRTRISQLCTLLGLVGGGVLLQWSDSQGRALWGFAGIFMVAALFRMWSVYWLSRHQTPGERVSQQNQRLAPSPVAAAPAAAAPATASVAASPGRAVAKRTSDAKPQRDSIGCLRLLSYLVAMQLMVQISGPYFAPYMLKQLHYSYGQFVTILAVSFVSKIIALLFWGRFARRFGAQRLLWTGGIGLVPVAALWVACDNIYQVAMVQMLSGVVWAAYELGFLLLFFEALPLEKRTRLLTFYNLANMIALCSGAFIGALVLKTLGGSAEAYGVLFVMSSAGRACALMLLVGASFREVTRRGPIQVCLRFLGVRPATSGVTSPILSTFDQRPHD